MGEDSTNSNNSNFFLSFTPLPGRNGKNVVFGEVILGHHIVRQILLRAGDPRAYATPPPSDNIFITNSGEILGDDLNADDAKFL